MTAPEERLPSLMALSADFHAKLFKAAATVAYLVFASVLLSWVALFNGAPLVFADTISYSTAAFEREVPGLFSIFYSIFLLPLHQGVTFWPVVFVQAAILAHLLYLTARTVTRDKIGKFETAVIVAVLAAFSSLPWITGEMLPDVFASVVLLGFFLIAFVDEQLSRAEFIYVSALSAFAIATHLSYVPIAAGLILLCLGLRMLFLPRLHTGRWLVPLILPLIVATVAMLAVNIVSSHNVSLARNGNVFLLAKWIDEGPALSYLKEVCPSAGYALCEHVSALAGKSHDDLKWSGGSPFRKLGTFDQLEPEAREIVRGTLYAHPYEILRNALIDAGIQLTRFRTGDGLTQEFARWVGDHVGRVYGAEVGGPFFVSKQARGELHIAEFRDLHLIGVAIGAGACIWLWLRRRALAPELWLLMAFVSSGIVWNAVVTGALSGPYDRYLARVIWLVIFAGLIGLVYLARHQPTPSFVREL